MQRSDSKNKRGISRSKSYSADRPTSKTGATISAIRARLRSVSTNVTSSVASVLSLGGSSATKSSPRNPGPSEQRMNKPDSTHEVPITEDHVCRKNTMPVIPYQVKDGETLAGLAAKFDTTPSELCCLNHLFSRTLFVGQTLKVPVRDSDKETSDPVQLRHVAPEGNGTLESIGLENSLQSGTHGPESKDATIYRSRSAEFQSSSSIEDDFEQHYIKVKVKYITESEGTVMGVLLATPNSFMFSPWSGDPAVAEYGEEHYTLEFPLQRIRSFTLFTDPSAVFSDRSARYEMAMRLSALQHYHDHGTGSLTIHRHSPDRCQEEGLKKECDGVEHGNAAGDSRSSPILDGAGPQDGTDEKNEKVHNYVNFSSGLFSAAAKDTDNSIEDRSPLVSGSQCAHSSAEPERQRRCRFEFVNAVSETDRHIDLKAGRLPKRKNNFDIHPVYLCVVAPGKPKDKKSRRVPLLEYWFMVPSSKATSLGEFLLKSSTCSPLTPVSFDAGPPSWNSTSSMGGDTEQDPASLETDYGFILVPKMDGTDIDPAVDWELVNKEDIERVMLDIDDAEPENLPIPEMLGESVLLDDIKIRDLLVNLPPAAEGYDRWILRYSTAAHGCSLRTLYRQCHDGEGPCVMLVQDSKERIFGAMLSHHPHMSEHFFGTGETYVFRWFPDFKKYTWSRKNSFFIKGGLTTLTIGCSDGHAALWLDDRLLRGRSQTCSTFGNPPLPGYEDFVIQCLEVWSFA